MLNSATARHLGNEVFLFRFQLLPDEKRGSSGVKSKRKREENSLKLPGSPAATPAKPKVSRNSVSQMNLLIAPEPVTDESEQSESTQEANQIDKHLTEMIQTTILKLNNQVTIFVLDFVANITAKLTVIRI